MKNGDLKYPEAGDLWINVATTEKFRILAIALYASKPVTSATIDSSRKVIVYHPAEDDSPTGPVIVKPLWDSHEPNLIPQYWQLDGINLFSLPADDQSP